MKAKKYLVLLLCSLLVFSALAVHSFIFASMPPCPSKMPYIESLGTSEKYAEKLNLIKDKYTEENTLPSDFVPADALIALGAFSQFHLYQPSTHYELYDAKKHVWKYRYEYETYCTETVIYSSVVEIRHCEMEKIQGTCSRDALEDPADMRTLDSAYHGKEQDLCLGRAVYHYNTEGELCWIKWEDGNRTFTLTMNALRQVRGGYWYNSEGDFEGYEGDGLMGELLNPRTARGALREFRARVAWHTNPIGVCITIAACVGVVVVAVVVFFVLRKRRGGEALAAAAAPVDAVTDTPTDTPTDITPPES